MHEKRNRYEHLGIRENKPKTLQITLQIYTHDYKVIQQAYGVNTWIHTATYRGTDIQKQSYKKKKACNK